MRSTVQEIPIGIIANWANRQRTAGDAIGKTASLALWRGVNKISNVIAMLTCC